jgi:hypothetical protein
VCYFVYVQYSIARASRLTVKQPFERQCWGSDQSICITCVLQYAFAPCYMCVIFLYYANYSISIVERYLLVS